MEFFKRVTEALFVDYAITPDQVLRISKFTGRIGTESGDAELDDIFGAGNWHVEYRPAPPTDDEQRSE